MHRPVPAHADTEILRLDHLAIRAAHHPFDRGRCHAALTSSDKTRRALVKFADRIRALARGMVAMGGCVPASSIEKSKLVTEPINHPSRKSFPGPNEKGIG